MPRLEDRKKESAAKSKERRQRSSSSSSSESSSASESSSESSNISGSSSDDSSSESSARPQQEQSKHSKQTSKKKTGLHDPDFSHLELIAPPPPNQPAYQIIPTLQEVVSPAGRDIAPVKFHPNKLVINRLTRHVTREHLLEIFSVFGSVNYVELAAPLMHPQDSHELDADCRIGYVQYDTYEEAAKAMKHMDGGQIDGQEITVVSAMPSLSPAQAARREPPPALISARPPPLKEHSNADPRTVYRGDRDRDRQGRQKSRSRSPLRRQR